MNINCIKNSLLMVLFAFCITSCKKNNTQHFEAISETKNTVDVLSYVDPFIGTGFHGHTYPGPVMPHGMVQLSPDTKLNGWDASSGYHNDDTTIYGFSHTHLSGTGIGDMGDVLLLPFTGTSNEKPVATFSKKNEHAEVGVYSVKFDNYQVKAELAVTERVGMHKYTYSKDAKKRLLFDLGHTLQRTWSNSNIANEIEFVDNKTIRGLKQTTGWANDNKVYFYAEFSSPFQIETVNVDSINTDTSKKIYKATDIYSYLNFESLENESLFVKVGISYVDYDGAKKNLKSELPHWDFNRVQQNAKDVWEKELQRIAVTTNNEETLITFYTALYHSMIAPMIYQDTDGRYRGMDKAIHQAQEGQVNYTVYSLWDTFRALHPLMTIIDEPSAINWANNLLLKYEQGGLLPKWPLVSNYTGTMVGYPAVANIADALTKNLKGIDKELALKAVLTSASYNLDLLKPIKEPRKERLMTLHNKFINEGKHIPSDKIGASVTYGLENAYYDWCIAQIAKQNNNNELATAFEKRALNYKLYFDAETGFMRGKNEDGSWVTPFNPKYSNHENSDYVEGNAWQWTWFVPHDIDGFSRLFKNKEQYIAKLDSLFTTSSIIDGDNASGDITGLIGQYAHGNEPSHHISYLYTYAGQPWKTQELVDQILKEFYTTKPDGIIGNEDCGQMSAWYIMSAMGFYQVAPGDPTYVIGRPLFDTVTIPLTNNKAFTIITKKNSAENKYVQKVTLNGKELKDLFFTHNDIKAGGTLTIEMGNSPQK
ncbi:GH92 family glycosyl hydrolase [Aureibaculum sp. A20]|uniref:GH92 family glycosyl hydrolase n=1 Tax=Aureibaculum flavum TaxID=2795986 RepID=A0ABS0WMK6_9FLAO|nr:GH92 family glycosyl hydrolase [Aureibaculum flavum]MBJ2173203.1 GH92 family glycosyl hydrolase [Aureibaculum flavum]